MTDGDQERDFELTMQGLERGLRVSSIMSYPLQVVAPQEDAKTVIANQGAGLLDCVPVQDGGQVLGVVYREDLLAMSDGIATAVEAMRPLHLVPIVSGATPISRLIQRMNETKEAYWLVLNGTRIDAIVTVSDLWKLPVRLLAFSKIAHLEQLMTRRIRDQWEGNGWLECLSKGRRDRVNETAAELRGVNEEIDPLEMACLPDKIRVLEKHPVHAELARSLGGVVELRNQVAHVREADAGVDSAWKLLDRLARIDEALSKLSGQTE